MKMKAPKFMSIAAAMISAAMFQSCVEKYDYSMSMTTEEQAEAMVGTWILTSAGTESPSFDENRESHVENNISTELESVTITDSKITFNFRSPAPFYLRSSETGNVWQAQENVTSYTFGHSITNIEHCAAVYYGTEENPSATIGYNEYATSSFFEFFTKDDVNATRMILHMDAGHDNDVLAGIHNCYLEFNRQ